MWGWGWLLRWFAPVRSHSWVREPPQLADFLVIEKSDSVARWLTYHGPSQGVPRDVRPPHAVTLGPYLLISRRVHLALPLPLLPQLRTSSPALRRRRPSARILSRRLGEGKQRRAKQPQRQHHRREIHHDGHECAARDAAQARVRVPCRVSRQ